MAGLLILGTEPLLARGAIAQRLDLPLADFLERLRAWIEPRDDVRALMIVGSVARGDARPDSDVDVVLLITHPVRYLESVVSEFGAAQRVEQENYGKVASVRAAYGDGLEVEYSTATGMPRRSQLRSVCLTCGYSRRRCAPPLNSLGR